MTDIDDHKTMFVTMDETSFKSTYMAVNYDDDCSSGHAANRHEHQPIEDASYLANLAWEQIQKAALL